MKSGSERFRFIFSSPWVLLVFLFIPLLFVLSVKFRLQLPLEISQSSVFYNNICFGVFAAIRFIYYLKGLTQPIRYGVGNNVPRITKEIPLSKSEVQNILVTSGYLFDDSGDYAEKHENGYLGVTALYLGLFIVLFTGSMDNLRQFSATLLHGVGTSLDLNRVDIYRAVATGPLTAKPTSLPKMRITRHFIPDAVNPFGAAEVLFMSADGTEKKVILKSPEPYRSGSFDIYMAGMLYEPTIAVSIDGATSVFNGKIMLKQLPVKENGFDFYAAFVEGNLDGEVYYQPEKSRLKMILRQGSNVLMNKELIFQVDRQQILGNISFTCERMGVWSKIHIIKRRHLPIIFMGGIVALIGLVMRLYFRPQRVWIEESQGGCRLKTIGRDAEKSLRVRD